ncbi:hypothetical protein ACFSUS_18215 [Spirosoma soli]|uniref:Uncharacterized protein n=1 Tax=Spirosoma soli TaxID=1770529 RepID=A0ABW5M6H8_9BACT
MKVYKSYWNGLLLIPPVIYYLFFLAHALNVPVGDDFIVILKFLIEWDWASSFAQKWYLLTQNFIEHRLVYTRFSALTVRLLVGQLDFRGVMLLGNLCLIGVLWILVYPLKATKLPAWYGLLSRLYCFNLLLMKAISQFLGHCFHQLHAGVFLRYVEYAFTRDKASPGKQLICHCCRDCYVDFGKRNAGLASWHDASDTTTSF